VNVAVGMTPIAHHVPVYAVTTAHLHTHRVILSIT